MKIDISQYIKSLSVAVDYAEKALAKEVSLYIAPGHGIRVAVMTNRMAAQVGLDEETMRLITQAALLHDCAVAEYLGDEFKANGQSSFESGMTAHCTAGENMLKKLPGYEKIPAAVLYHHECADGSGAFGLRAEETPIYAQLIHLADSIDVMFSLDYCDAEKYESMHSWISDNTGTLFSKDCADAFLKGVDLSLLKSLSSDKAGDLYDEILPRKTVDISIGLLREMSSVFAEITDYKSHFTWRHSMGIAEKAETMGRYYALADEDCSKLYIAGALHDIGKLLISNDILEKPGRLSSDEYREIQNHALGTWNLLKGISGLEDITLWAALHHEKLDGSGYPFGYTGEKLDKNSRLLACLDIYQALVEDRPYKSGMSHTAAMAILKKMGNDGQLDTDIISDIDSCFASSEDTAQDKVEKEKVIPQASGYRCPICGYFLEGELPDDFICPQCEQPGSIFEKI